MSEPVDETRPQEVARSERILDAVANHEPVDFADCEPEDREMVGLLEEWRDELRARPTDDVCFEHGALQVLNRGLDQRRRGRRRLELVGAVAAAVVGVTVFGAVLSQVKPGDALYGVRATVLGEPASVHDDKIAVSAEADLDQVEQMIELGHWDQAQDKLAAVGEHVQTVRDADRKRGLIEKVNRLNAKVVLRNGHPPPAGPGTSVVDIPRRAPDITMSPNAFGG